MILKIPNCLVILALILYQAIAAKTASSLSNETDYQALLAFKSQIISDPFEALSSWKDSIHFCDWSGVTCGKKHQRVTALNLMSLNLVGHLSPHIGNLTFLRVLNLNTNGFSGTIPQEIGRLTRLQTLSLVNNSLDGELPENLTSCAELLILNLSGNNLSGHILNGLGSMLKLTRLGLTANRLSGEIPPSLGNLSALTHLYLADNHIEGSLPSELGNLSSLVFFQLSINNLSGHIPPSLFNISSIVLFSVAFNNLSGSLPSDLFITLPKLQDFYAGGNRFSGYLPASIVNASELVQIDIVLNSFMGSIPSDLGGLKNLQLLSFGGNLLGTEEGDDLRFLTSLVNCTELRLVWLPLNSLKGSLPDSIGNLSTTLMSLRLDQNLVSGTVPSSIGNIVNLELLSLYENLLTGGIPDTIGRLSVLQEFSIHQNNISGIIPSSIGNMTFLTQLSLGENMLEGPILASIGNCTYLNQLYLSQNRLNGPLPGELFGLSSLSGLHLAQNRFIGPIPSQVGNLINLGIFNLSENSMSGEIPSTFGSCLVLESLSLEGNKLYGTIPSSLISLRGLQSLDLSRNNFSGQIPGFLAELTSLKNLNLSFNMFEGEVPKGGVFSNLSAVSVSGNSRLCGGPPTLKLPRCEGVTKDRKKSVSRRTVLAISMSISTFLLLVVIASTVLYRSKIWKRETAIPSLAENHPKLSYAELSQATAGFSPDNMIGEGSFGAVYRGVLLGSEQVVAIKVLKLEEPGASKSFMAECEALRNIRHRNLIKTITSCSTIDFRGEDFKALVFEFVPNGSLEKWLHPISTEVGGVENSITLSLVQRINIAIDVGTALEYLHHQCQIPIVHCDLKPSNVLIGSEFSAHVGDFGLAKFLVGRSGTTVSSSIGIRGTIGYVAPEYGVGGEASTEGDVYSYGILLLELFTGKRPTGPMFGDNFSLRQFVERSLPHELLLVVDPVLHLGGGEVEVDGSLLECLESILQVGLMCSASMPDERTDIREAVVQLRRARAALPVDI